MSKKEYEIYQDKNGNVYNLATELEHLLTNDIEEALDKIIELMEENTKLQNIIKEVRKWVYENQCKFTRDDEIVVSEVSFTINAKPCELLKILDKGEH